MGNAADPDGQAFDRIEKGRYLTTVADCFACHTVPNGGKPFAGGRPIETPFGIITSSNITPDNETGIGAWSDQQFDDAVRKGVRPDGSRLYPAMPFPAYTKMTRDDVLAIRAYLATVEPVHQPVKANTLPFPFNIRVAMRAWDALYFTEGEFQPDSQQSAGLESRRLSGAGSRALHGLPYAEILSRRRQDRRQSARLQPAGLVCARYHRRYQPGAGPVERGRYHELSEDRPQPDHGRDRTDGRGSRQFHLAI